MKKLLLLILSLLTIKMSAQTTIPGGYVYGTWTLAGSPYLVQGSLMIPNDSTLTIQPGVTVNFQGHYKLYVSGRLLAIGTQTDSIFFTAANKITGWYGIRFDTTHVTNDTSRFSYCSLSYGIANGSGYDAVGAAFYFNGFSKAVISNCLMKNCTTTWNSSPSNLGAIITCLNSSPCIINNSIFANKGGGISYQSGNPKILNNTISYNTSSGNNMGIGIMGWFSTNPVINNNTIIHNNGIGINVGNGTITSNTVSYNATGGIYLNNASPQGALVSHNLITYNTGAYGYAGGMQIFSSTVTVSYNIISNNSSPSGGGGILISTCNPILTNNLIANNTANGSGTSGNGGAMMCINSSPVLTNNTIVNNSANNGGGIYLSSTSIPSFTNCILYGNTASTDGAQVFINDQPSEPNFYYSDVQGGTTAFGLNGNFYTGNYSNNINSSPVFVSPSGGSGTGFNGAAADWNLQSTSPCINTGNPSGSYPATDLANSPRVVGTRIDIGSYEFQGPSDIFNSNTQNGISIFPNPANDFFMIAPTTNEKETLEIYNINGILVMSKYVLSKTICDISMLDAGVYSLVVKSGHNKTTSKLVVVH